MLKLLFLIVTVCSGITINIPNSALSQDNSTNATTFVSTSTANATDDALHANDSLLTKAVSFTKADMPQVLKDNKVVLFTLSYCPWCKKTKKWLKKKGVAAYYVVVDKLDNKDDVITYVNDYSGDDKYPKIFVNGEFLGSLQKLKDLHKDKAGWNEAMEKTDW